MTRGPDDDIETDGGEEHPPRVIEVHERLASVEANQERVVDALEDIDEKLDDVQVTVHEVRDESVTHDYLESEVKPVIQRSERTVTVLKWLGGASAVLVGALSFSVGSGVVP